MIDTLVSEITVPANHPSLAGHFPGRPVVPAVVLLDATMAAIETRGEFSLRKIVAAKFLQPVLPDERVVLEIRFAELEAAQLRASFKGSREGSVVFEGSLLVSRSEQS